MLGRIERGIDAPLAQRDLFAAGHDAIVDAGEPHVTSREDGADAAIDAAAANGCDGGEATAVEAAARTEAGRCRAPPGAGVYRAVASAQGARATSRGRGRRDGGVRG